MGLAADVKVLYHLLLKPVRGQDHAERMESFYAGQADAYDEFRRRLLRGREELCQHLQFPDDAIWIDLGGGTGANLEFVADTIPRLKKVYVVDLSQSLLQRAAQRAAQRGWNHVEPVAADATSFNPPEGRADIVTFSYSLTMIPDWFAAIDNARRLLAGQGQLGVVDFYVSRKHPEAGRQQHRWWTRSFWPTWFANDNVFLSADHLPYLNRSFQANFLTEQRAKVPYLPFVRVPYYIFVGNPRPNRITATDV